jgi:hypothetical protein
MGLAFEFLDEQQNGVFEYLAGREGRDLQGYGFD